MNRLCADELKILEFLNSSENNLLLTQDNDTQILKSFLGTLPVIDVNINQKSGGYIIGIKNLSYLSDKVKFNSPENINMYLDNMIALGLLLKPAMIRVHGEDVYNFLKKSILIKKLEEQLTEGQTIGYSEARIETTELGTQLLQVASKYEN